jgi:2-keto-4-pentenoate hydratase/2-oxohepta-3-ene-1,7-dioic acid hydratase in catechol pathway
MPGEVIGSGTVGNGCELERGAWGNDGDCVELNVHGIGTLWNTVRAASP